MNNKQEKQRQVLKRNEGSGGGERGGPGLCKSGYKRGGRVPLQNRRVGQKESTHLPLKNRFERSVFLCTFTVPVAGRGSLENVCGPQACFG